MDLAALQKSLSGKGKLPPVEHWNPDFCGDIDLQIKQDGQWYYMGTPIGRRALVKLFSGVLKCEEQDYFLVTPVEKVGIKVEDVPFIITQWRYEDGYLVLTSSLDDEIVVSQQNPVELRYHPLHETWLPYVLVRRNLWGRLHQNVLYQLTDHTEAQQITCPDTDKEVLQIKSGDYSLHLGYL